MNQSPPNPHDRMEITVTKPVHPGIQECTPTTLASHPLPSNKNLTSPMRTKRPRRKPLETQPTVWLRPARITKIHHARLPAMGIRTGENTNRGYHIVGHPPQNQHNEPQQFYHHDWPRKKHERNELQRKHLKKRNTWSMVDGSSFVVPISRRSDFHIFKA